MKTLITLLSLVVNLIGYSQSDFDHLLDDIPRPGGIDQTRDLINLVQYTSLLNENLQTLTVPRDQVRGCYHIYNNHFYQDMPTYRRYLVERCLSEVDEGTSVSVTGPNTSPCSETRTINHGNFDHVVSKRNNKLVISLTLNYSIQLRNSDYYFESVSERRQNEIREIVRKCHDFAENYFSRFDIELDLNMREYSPFIVNKYGLTDYIPGGDFEVNDAYTCYSASRLWCINIRSVGEGCYDDRCAHFGNENEKNINRSCLNFVRAISYRLGLDGESRESLDLRACPQKAQSFDTDPYSIMQFPHNGPYDNDEFMPRHIKTMISPLCPRINNI